MRKNWLFSQKFKIKNKSGRAQKFSLFLPIRVPPSINLFGSNKEAFICVSGNLLARICLLLGKERKKSVKSGSKN
jgi:hypothetical protein